MEEVVFQKKRQRSCNHEKIVLLVDKHNNVNSVQGWSDDNVTILDSIKTYLEVLILRKLKMTLKHEIAIVSFDEAKVILNSDFSRNEKSLISKLKSIDNENECNSINITEENNLNEIVNHSIEILRLNSSVSDNCINLRFILIYARDISPIINEIAQFLYNPWVYFDILYLHAKVTKEVDDLISNYQEIFDNLALFQQAISDSNRNDNDNNEDVANAEEKINYIYDSHNSSLRLSTYITSLLAHSAIRDAQHEFLQKLDKKSKVT